jgi:uncharacterized protein (DUF2461 family)
MLWSRAVADAALYQSFRAKRNSSVARHMQLNTPGEYETIDWWHMTADQRKRALQLIARPPRRSKLAAAKKYGVDLTLLIENLSLTPTERAKKLSSGAKSLRALRLAGERHRSKK